MTVHETEPFNAEPPPAALAEASPTATETFYVRNHGPVPDVTPADWRLRLDGLVHRAGTLTLRELQDFERHEVLATIQCAGNRRAGLTTVRDIPGEDPWGPGATSTARWGGARLRDVLAAVGIDDAATDVAFEAPDVSSIAKPPQRFGSSIPIEKACRHEVLLAWAMNDRPLPQVHGAPVRIVVPGYIGARSVKWVDRIKLRKSPSDNYFQTTAYRLLPPQADPEDVHVQAIPLGPIALNSAILDPPDGAVLAAGTHRFAGYALAGADRQVARVDISTDNGRTWDQADLGEQDSPWAWRLWSAEVTLRPGRTRVLVRAWDDTAALQPENPAHLWNPKGYANNSWSAVDLTIA